MQIRRLAVLIIAAAMMFCTLGVYADDLTATPRIDKREANQERRIQQGVNSGALNQREAARLERGERRMTSSVARSQGRDDVLFVTVSKKERTRMTPYCTLL